MSLDKVIELLENDSSVLERFAIEFAERVEERKRKQDYVTKNITDLFDELVSFLNRNHCISCEDIMYDNGKIPQSIKEYFSEIFDVLKGYAEKNYLVKGCDMDYEFIVKVNEQVVRFNQYVGQGTLICAVIEKDSDKEFFTIEQFVDDYSFDTTVKREKIALEIFRSTVKSLKLLKIEHSKLVDLFTHAYFSEEDYGEDKGGEKL